MSAAQPRWFALRPQGAQQQLWRWAKALSDGLIEGFGGPALGLAIQAQLPVHAPAQSQILTLQGASE